MKISKNQLRQIIREETRRVLSERSPDEYRKQIMDTFILPFVDEFNIRLDSTLYTRTVSGNGRVGTQDILYVEMPANEEAVYYTLTVVPEETEYLRDPISKYISNPDGNVVYKMPFGTAPSGILSHEVLNNETYRSVESPRGGVEGIIDIFYDYITRGPERNAIIDDIETVYKRVRDRR